LDQVVAFLGPAGGPAHAALASHVALRLLSDSPGDDGGPSVRFANGVWVDAAMRLKVDYAALVSEHYRAQALPASFKDMVRLPALPLQHFSTKFAPESRRATSRFASVYDCYSQRRREPRSTGGSRARRRAGSRASCPRAPSTARRWPSSGTRSTSRAPGAASSTPGSPSTTPSTSPPAAASARPSCRAETASSTSPAAPATRSCSCRTRAAASAGTFPCTSTSRTSATACRACCTGWGPTRRCWRAPRR
uniref:Serpin domain-containing protein n=1 Tax=Aegilops tauschii subsp. strangulata TaxID=200361 RepID=A0A453FKY0_AEGTS